MYTTCIQLVYRLIMEKDEMIKTKKNISELVYESLHEEILAGIHKEDEILGEMAIAERFNVSRTPVRQALQRLANEGFVRIVPGVGTLVCNYSWKDTREVFAIRQVLEAFAGGLTAFYADEEVMEKFEQVLEKMETAKNNNDKEKYEELDNEFHGILNNNCGNSKLIDLIEKFNDQSKLANLHRVKYNEEDALALSFRGHKKIYAAIKNRDANCVNRELFKHSSIIFGEITGSDIKKIFDIEDW